MWTYHCNSPDDPANVGPDTAVAVNLTDVPFVNLALHVDPQLIPVGLLVIVPVQFPAFATVRTTGASVTVAVTVALAFRVTAHLAVPVQAPVQWQKLSRLWASP